MSFVKIKKFLHFFSPIISYFILSLFLILHSIIIATENNLKKINLFLTIPLSLRFRIYIKIFWYMNSWVSLKKLVFLKSEIQVILFLSECVTKSFSWKMPIRFHPWVESIKFRVKLYLSKLENEMCRISLIIEGLCFISAFHKVLEGAIFRTFFSTFCHLLHGNNTNIILVQLFMKVFIAVACMILNKCVLFHY